MNKVPFYNDKDHAVFMGGVMVPPNETRLVDENLLPAVKQIAEQEEMPDTLAELLKGNVESVVSKLPELSRDEIERLGDLEQTGQQRKGILGAIAEYLLKQAAEQE